MGLKFLKHLINPQKLIFSWSSLGFPKNATLKANRYLATTLKQRLGIKSSAVLRRHLQVVNLIKNRLKKLTKGFLEKSHAPIIYSLNFICQHAMEYIKLPLC